MIIVDGTGEFQYSTQFSVLSGKGSSGSSSSASASVKPTASVTNSAGSIILGPPAQQTGATSDLTTTIFSYPYNSTASGWHSTASVTGSASSTSDYFNFGEDSTTLATQTGSRPVAASTTSTTGTATGAGVGAATFTDAADRLGLNAAGLAVVGAVAMFAL